MVAPLSECATSLVKTPVPVKRSGVRSFDSGPDRSLDFRGNNAFIGGSTVITVHPRPDTLDRNTVEAYRSVAPATLGHALETAMEPSIRALWRPVKLVGPALTVETARDLYAAVNEAVAIAQPGDVLVVATGRDPRHAITGEFTLRTAQEHGIAGMVVDALMADARALESMQFPVFCWGSSPALLSAVPRQSREPQGALNVPVEVGGVLVNPGDSGPGGRRRCAHRHPGRGASVPGHVSGDGGGGGVRPKPACRRPKALRGPPRDGRRGHAPLRVPPPAGPLRPAG